MEIKYTIFPIPYKVGFNMYSTHTLQVEYIIFLNWTEKRLHNQYFDSVRSRFSNLCGEETLLQFSNKYDEYW